jgi:polysaccharide chain length determinant protein (PEP-CTERM system associated)
MEPTRSSGLPIKYILSILSRRRWFLIVPFCVAIAVGIYLAITLPKQYEASTLILVRPANVPASYVQSIVTSNIETRISTISQQILSRTNIEKVIAQFRLFSDPDQENMLMEDKVASLRDSIKVEVTRSRRNADADAFSISYRGPHPRKVMQVANGLASAFINENLKVREAQAVGTSNFLEDELKAKRERLLVVEEKLKEYRRAHMGELPEQLESNLRILESLQSQLNDKEQTLRNVRVGQIAVENELRMQREAAAADASSRLPAASDDELTLAQMKERLANMRTQYTDRHPDVLRLQGLIERMESEQAVSQDGSQKGGSSQAAPGTAKLVSQRIQMAGVMRSTQIEIDRLKEQIKEYQRRVEAIPNREQELISLRRDYENIQESYNSLLNRKLEAEIAVNMEKKQKGEQFRIIDPARTPQRPVSPDLRRLFLITLAAGLGLGAASVFLLEKSDTTLRRPDDFEIDLGLAVLATVPKILTRRDRFKMRLNKALTTASIVFALALVGGMATLVFLGVEPALDLVRRYVSL